MFGELAQNKLYNGKSRMTLAFYQFTNTTTIYAPLHKTIKVDTPEKLAPHAINVVSDNDSLHGALALQTNCFYGNIVVVFNSAQFSEVTYLNLYCVLFFFYLFE